MEISNHTVAVKTDYGLLIFILSRVVILDRQEQRDITNLKFLAIL